MRYEYNLVLLFKVRLTSACVNDSELHVMDELPERMPKSNNDYKLNITVHFQKWLTPIKKVAHHAKIAGNFFISANHVCKPCALQVSKLY